MQNQSETKRKNGIPSRFCKISGIHFPSSVGIISEYERTNFGLSAFHCHDYSVNLPQYHALEMAAMDRSSFSSSIALSILIILTGTYNLHSGNQSHVVSWRHALFIC